MAYPPIITAGDLTLAQSGDLTWFSLQATAAIRAYCGWHVAPVITEELVLDTPCALTMLLPTMRLVNVISATIDGVDVLPDLEWSSAGMITNVNGFSKKFRGLTINIEHGFEIEDTPLVGLIASLTARAKLAPSGVVSQGRTVGPFNEQMTFATVSGGGTPGLTLLESEKAQLAPYRLTWGL